jgi:hypothetical protein
LKLKDRAVAGFSDIHVDNNRGKREFPKWKICPDAVFSKQQSMSAMLPERTRQIYPEKGVEKTRTIKTIPGI